MTNMDLSDECMIFDNDYQQLKRWCGEFGRSHLRAPTYFIRTFGCQQNDHDSEIAAGILEEAGFLQAVSVDESDLVLFNTCSVRANADRRFFGHVGSLKPLRRGGAPLIGVFGCMMEQPMHRDRVISTFPYVDFILGAGAMQLLPYALITILDADESHKQTLDMTGTESDVFAHGLPVRRTRSHRALLTIMTGCNNFCSYCIVPHTRGREISRPYEHIMEEARRAVKEGATEIMLLGQNVNSYGNDVRLKGGEAISFATLLKEISLIDELGIVRYMTSHPKDLSDELIEVIGSQSRVEPHIHLPLQSGSDVILKKMNRRYTAGHYLERVRKLRTSRPGITVSTDLIVGFPGETEQDFEDTLQVMREVRFDAAFTFIYSPRTGTPAASWYDEKEQASVHERFERLVTLQNAISLESNQVMVGKTVDVLIDGPSRRNPDILSGRARDDRLVNVSLNDEMSLPGNLVYKRSPAPGEIAKVKIDRAGSFSLEGTMVTEIKNEEAMP